MYYYENPEAKPVRTAKPEIKPEIKPAKPKKKSEKPAKAVKRMLAVFMVVFLLFSPVVSVTGAEVEADQEAKTGWQAYDGKRISAVQAGKCDFCTGMNVTEERKEQVLFSDPTYDGGIVLAVPSQDVSGKVDAAADSAASEPEFRTFEELNGKTISMITGAPFEELISSKVPQVKEFTYYQTMPDMMLGVRSGKTDAGLMNNAVAELAANKDPELAIFPESLGETAFGFAFQKGDERCRQWQEAYDRIPAETRDALWKKWTGADDTVKTVPDQDWPGANGTVQVAACDALEPMSYVGQNGDLLGLDIETILLIARELDVHVEFTPMDFSAVLSSIGSGKADIGCGSIVTSDERKETMDFVEYHQALFVLIVRAGGSARADHSFLAGVRESFY